MAASATRRQRQILLLAIVVAAVVVTLLMPAFTLLYATRLSPPGLIAGLLLILFMVVMPVVLLWLRLRSERIGEGRAAGIGFKPGAPVVGLAVGVVSLLLLFIAQAMEAESFLAKSHWLLQLVLIVGLVAVILLLFITVPGKVRNDLNDAALDNADRRQRVITNLARLQRDGWIATGMGQSAIGRFKAALGWWQEELTHALPERGLALADEQVTFVLEEARRQLSLINDLAQRPQVSEDIIVDAEKRVLDSIELIARLAPKSAA